MYQKTSQLLRKKCFGPLTCFGGKYIFIIVCSSVCERNKHFLHVCVCLNQRAAHFDTFQAQYDPINFTRIKLLFMRAYLTFSSSSWNEAFMSTWLCEEVTAACQLVSCLIISHLSWTHAAKEKCLTSSKSDEGTSPPGVRFINLKNCSEPRGGRHPRLCVENLTSCTQTQWNDNEAHAHCTQTGNVLFEGNLNNLTISRITEQDKESHSSTYCSEGKGQHSHANMFTMIMLTCSQW